MIAAGIDVGALSVKVVLLGDGTVAARALERTGFDPAKAAARALGTALAAAGATEGDLGARVATGAGRRDVRADGVITDVIAAAGGIHHLRPDVRTLVDVGAEEGRAVRVSGDGSVIDFVVNEKCAAGSGAFIEAMARALEVTVEELGALSLESERETPLNAQCAVFAESEVVGLVHSGAARQDIARAVHDAISRRVVSMTRRIGIEERVAVAGGLARNAGFVDALARGMGATLVVPDDPGFVGALGAALAAAGGSAG